MPNWRTIWPKPQTPLMESGMAEAEALIAARRQLGNYTIQKERTRDMDLATWLEQLFADAVYGIRQLKQSPGFTAVAVLSLALGIGANTAIFQLVNAMRLKLLPVKDPEQLAVVIGTKTPHAPECGIPGARTSRTRNGTFSARNRRRFQR